MNEREMLVKILMSMTDEEVEAVMLKWKEAVNEKAL